MVAAAVTLSGTAAHAGAHASPGSASGSNWAGFYAGAFAGTVFGVNRFEERGTPAAATAGKWKNTPAGVTLGYNYEFTNMIVVGAEIDYSFSEIKANGSSSAGFNCGVGNCRATVDDFVTARARVGLDFGKLLAFGTVGYGRGKAEGSGTAGGVVLGSNTLSGIVWGFGLEYLVTNNLSIKGEYLNADLGRLELPNSCVTNCFTDINFQTARIGLNYQF